MRKSERLRYLEMKVVQIEMLLDLYSLAIRNLLESQGMEPESALDSGKWYQKKQDNS